jgi:Uma2 family endonuclease
MITESAIERVLYSGPGHTLMVRPAHGEDPEILFAEVCTCFANTRIEQDAEGNIFIMAPNGGESSSQNSEITTQLRIWAKQDGRGRVFDPSILFIFPDGSKMSPDASWVSNEQLETLTASERRKFLALVPEFVIELRSPGDRIRDLEKKMEIWRPRGVALGWLIDPVERLVKIYRAGWLDVETQHSPELIGCEKGPVAGFLLGLAPV